MSESLVLQDAWATMLPRAEPDPVGAARANVCGREVEGMEELQALVDAALGQLLVLHSGVIAACPLNKRQADLGEVRFLV